MDKKEFSENIVLMIIFVVAVSLMDYYAVMLFALDRIPDALIYQVFLTTMGYWATLIYFLVTRNLKRTLSVFVFFALGKFLTEHVFYIWVNLLGDPRMFYTWYTHNPLNPDGKWGYNWTILGLPGNIPIFALLIVAYYLPGYLVLRWLVKNKYKK
jgi:hypothetical protein